MLKSAAKLPCNTQRLSLCHCTHSILTNGILNSRATLHVAYRPTRVWKMARCVRVSVRVSVRVRLRTLVCVCMSTGEVRHIHHHIQNILHLTQHYCGDPAHESEYSRWDIFIIFSTYLTSVLKHFCGDVGNSIRGVYWRQVYLRECM